MSKRNSGGAVKTAGLTVPDKEIPYEENEDEQVIKKHAGGRPKSALPKLDMQYKKRFDEACGAVTTLQENLGNDATEGMLIVAIKKKFNKEGDSSGQEQADGILKFLQEQVERNDASVAEKEGVFGAKLAEFKAGGSFDQQKDNYLASIRKANLAELEEHEQFLDVCVLGIKYYKELYLTEKSENAKRDGLIRTALQGMKDDAKERVRDVARFASAASQEVDEID